MFDTFCLFHNEHDALSFFYFIPNSRHPNIRFTIKKGDLTQFTFFGHFQLLLPFIAKRLSRVSYYKHSILKLIYKMYFNDSPPCMTAHIAKSQPSYNLRNSLKLEIPKFKSNIKKSSVSYRGTILWNLLPIGCRMANSVNSFSKIINNLTLVKDINFANIYCRR